MKKVLITGANRGLGLALAQQFFEKQYDLYLVVRSVESQQKLINIFPNANILVFDITENTFELTLSQWLENISLDVVVNNAGTGSKAPTLAATKAGFLRKEFETNCIAILSTVKGSLDALKCAETPLVLNISSRRGSLTMQSELAAKGTGCSYSYRISKAAQNMLTLCLADDLEDLGVRVVAIHPGRLLTQMGASDALLSPAISAQRIVTLVENSELENRDYINIETGEKLPW